MDSASILITGGAGLQGSHIIEKLIAKYPSARMTSISRSSHPQAEFPGATYLPCDITSSTSVRKILDNLQPDVVFHCAALIPVTRAPMPDSLVRSVNVDGTRVLLEECSKAGVKAFIFTSSTSVIQTQNNGMQVMAGADETWSTITEKDNCPIYPTTKAAAERLVLAANEEANGGMKTCSLRPAAIYGERDNDLLPGMMAAVRDGKVKKIQIGDNTNLTSWTYAGNSADGHILAASALLREHQLPSAPPREEKVQGEAFFLTNALPAIPFWDMSRAVALAMGDPVDVSQVRVLSARLGWWVGYVSEWLSWWKGVPPRMSRYMSFMCSHDRWVRIDKARSRFGYEPGVQWEDGVGKGVRWFLDHGK